MRLIKKHLRAPASTQRSIAELSETAGNSLFSGVLNCDCNLCRPEFYVRLTKVYLPRDIATELSRRCFGSNMGPKAACIAVGQAKLQVPLTVAD